MKIVSKLLICMAMVMASTGCEKGGEKIEKLALMGSNNLSGYSGEFLENPIRLEWSGWEGVNYHVHARFIEGTGFIAGRGGFDSFYSSGQEWEFNCKLGGESVQKIEISLYKGDVYTDASGRPFIEGELCDRVVVTVNVSHRKGWAYSAGLDSNMTYYDDQIVSYDDETLYLIHYHKLYSSVDGGANWSAVTQMPRWDKVSELRFNSRGWAYALTEGYGVFYTKDGKEWTKINNGFLDCNLNSKSGSCLYVDDELLMASFNNGLYISTDDGLFWKKQLVNTETFDDGYRFMNRLANGDIIVLDRWDDLWLSSNMGESWTKAASGHSGYGTPVKSMEVGYDDRIWIGDEYHARLAILDPANNFSVESHSYYEFNHGTQAVSNIKRVGDTMYYVVNSPLEGLYSSRNNWAKINTGFSGEILNYYVRKDGTFILISDKGVHYFRK